MNKKREEKQEHLRILDAKAVFLHKFAGKQLGGEIIEPGMGYLSQEVKSPGIWQQGWTQSIELALNAPQEAEWEQCKDADTENKCDCRRAQQLPSSSHSRNFIFPFSKPSDSDNSNIEKFVQGR
ncbi:hypothetical protein F511_03759 [Dorcoceras hygrometricum]|uniref:Uncharacterized protein n=1 Tax=Dorcoceras hygrometricum TaxID=472368 RepID=A0A2Z7BCE7_9LAMI|nr:hypothetical protein F511_03759 [Dorcoceras hygrometricum]